MEEFSSVCKNCGSDIAYNPKQKCLTCKYCGSNFYLPTSKRDGVIVRQYSVGFHPNMLNSNLNSYKCNSCGRVYYMATEGKSSRCPNCGNSSCSLISDPGYCADGIIPFQITKEEASKAFQEYLKSNNRVPSELKALALNQKLMAVYIPVWNFSFNMYASYSAIEKTLQKDEYDSYYSVENPIFGEKTKRIQSMDECATDGEDETFLDLFDEKDYEKIIPYIPEYSLGTRVDPITKDIHGYYSGIVEKAENDFERQIKSSLINRKKETINVHVSAKAKDVFFNFTYVPVYVNAFKYRDKLYKIYISGTTGKVTGKTPTSLWYKVKKLLKVVGFGAVIAILYLLLKK